jgi:hypothetical protein
MTNKKRFERIYADVDVFCRDHNANGISQLIEKEDYDKIVDLLNDLHYENYNLELHSKSQSKAYHKLLDSFTRLKRKNKELKFQLKECRENKLYSRRKLEEENTHIKNTITEMYNNERTELGKSTLKQLLETIQ